MAHIHEKFDFTVAIFVVHDGKDPAHPSSQARQVAAARRTHRTGRRPGAGRVARGEGRKRPRRGTARRTSAHDFARHARAHRAALSRHPSHQRNARAHRPDLLGPTEKFRWAIKSRKATFLQTRVLATEEHHDIRWCSAGELDKLQPPMSDAVKWYCRKAIEEISAAK